MTIHCKVTVPGGKLVVSKWSSSTGKFKEKVKIGGRAQKGTATESGTTVTVNSSNVAAITGRVGSVSKSGSKLVMTFHFSDSKCPSSGSVVFVNDHPATAHGKHPKKKHHK